MKIKGLGRNIKAITPIGAEHETEYDLKCVDKIVQATEPIPYCVKQASGGKAGIIYYDKIGHCIKAAQGVFYFEAKISDKLFAKLQEYIIAGKKAEAFNIISVKSTSYNEIS